jgi:hypothetical protein
LFEFLDAYDFGAEGAEDIQEDNKTLINASVLGLIFEKINGYKDGSFFTPGFITMYMCRETIRKAVVQKFNETKKDEKVEDQEVLFNAEVLVDKDEKPSFTTDLQEDQEKVKKEFDRVDKIWREKARSIINNDLIKYNTPELRKNLTNNFSVFIENLKSRPLKDLNPTSEEETTGTLSEIKVILYEEAKSINKHPETIGMVMRENGINTHAKTHAGLKRVFDGLSYEQQVKICESLESIKCS